jgi:uncharacterized protein (DUF1810 family)
MDDPFNLARFVGAQDPVYAAVCAELRAGSKTSHWMWFIFPQLQGLGSSSMARHYAIRSVDEARAYLDHPVLGPRLRECTKLVNGITGRTSNDIFGHVDSMKFCSSMSLFAQATPDNEAFEEAIKKYCRR